MEKNEKLTKLREAMTDNEIAAYIIPSSDPHISEYLPDRFKNIEWLSGFTGSAGTLVITHNFAGLWTDSRYFVQAREQLEGTGFELVKLKNQGAPEYIEWLYEKFNKGDIIAFDGELVSISLALHIKNSLEAKGLQIRENVDLLNAIWVDRPSLPKSAAYLLPEYITGKNTRAKLEQVQTDLNKYQADYHLISTLDDIAWIFNLRGSDVKCNPVTLSFALISKDHANLFIDESKLQEVDRLTLNKYGVEIMPYTTIKQAISAIPNGARVLIDPMKNCYHYRQLVPGSCTLLEFSNPSTMLKAIKNETELNHIRDTMIKDGVALTRFFYWLEQAIGKEKISEITISEKLLSFRKEQQDFVGESFDTIAAYKEHGALPHYKAVPDSNLELAAEGLILIDSGGQYKTGTTDITRVVSLGKVTPEQQKDYTLVLKAMIEGSTTYFPEGTKGYQIDAITRKPLWDHLRNYGHGTGHGVGFFLNVHEGPQVFNTAPINIHILENMITSIEPGIYREGRYGIRIENLVVSKLNNKSQFGRFMSFETLTLCYIDTSLVNPDLLDAKHIDWLNSYHKTVFDNLSPYLTETEKRWLNEKTKAI